MKSGTSRRGSASSEKKRSKSRARSKSPFRSFRWPKKSKPEAAEAASYSDDEDNLRRSFERPGDELKSMLSRKHEWESTTKKTSNRSWDRVCVVLKGNQIGFYKDQNAYKAAPEATFKGEPAVDVGGARADVATDYKKKNFVFRLKLANGGEYLFQGHDEEEMRNWVDSINQASGGDDAGAAGPSGAARAQTLPTGQQQSAEQKKKAAGGGFFTLKPKK